MSDLLSNLAAAFGQDESAGPDPQTLPGLLQLAESALEENAEAFRALHPHFESMTQKILVAASNLDVLSEKVENAPSEIVEAVENNAEAFQAVAECLEEILEYSPETEKAELLETLSDFREASQLLEETSRDLVELSQNF